MAGPAPGDRGELAGLRSRSDLNGRRVEVRGQAPVKPGGGPCPRFRVELLFGAGAGTVLKVKAANLDLDKDRVLEDPALNTLVAAMQALAPGAPPPEERRDWAGGLPDEVLEKVAWKLVAQTEARAEAKLKRDALGYWTEERIQKRMAERRREGNCLFVVALVCKGWRKAQLKVGGPLRTRVLSDVILPGSVALAKWALAEGCPRDDGRRWDTMASRAVKYGHPELVKWLCRKGGFAMDECVMLQAARSGNLELVQWLRAEGCPWDWNTCFDAVAYGHVEVLRWARENGCPWTASARDRAARKLGYTDDLDFDGNPVQSDDESSDE